MSYSGVGLAGPYPWDVECTEPGYTFDWTVLDCVQSEIGKKGAPSAPSDPSGSTTVSQDGGGTSSPADGGSAAAAPSGGKPAPYEVGGGTGASYGGIAIALAAAAVTFVAVRAL